MKEIIRKLILFVCVCVFAYSAYNLITIYFDYKSIDDSNNEIIETYTAQKEEEGYLQIDWTSLLNRNSDIKAWIQIPDSEVNYPVVQGKDNDEYLHSNLDKESFRAGTIFIDSRNQNPFVDLNTIIYGHNMNNGSMFANIKSYTEQSYADEHPYIFVYLPNGTVNRYKVFAAHIIAEDSSLYNCNVSNVQQYYNDIIATSDITVDFDHSKNQPVITLSTCPSGGSETGKRNVVHAVLEETITV